MAVDDHGLEVLKKSAEEVTTGDKSDYFVKVSNLNFELLVLRGQIAGWELKRFFGQNRSSSIGIADDVWDGGNSFGGFVDSAGVLSVSSDNSNDTILGTGARQLLVDGLDENYLEISETIDLDGTNLVSSVKSFFRINSAKIISVGSSLSNIGNITAKIGTNLVVYIFPGDNRAHQAFYTVPANKTALQFLFISYIIPSEKAFGRKYGQLLFKVREFGGQFFNRTSVLVDSNTSPSQLNVSASFSEKTDLRWQFKSETQNTFVALSYRFFLVSNGSN